MDITDKLLAQSQATRPSQSKPSNSAPPLPDRAQDLYCYYIDGRSQTMIEPAGLGDISEQALTVIDDDTSVSSRAAMAEIAVKQPPDINHQETLRARQLLLAAQQLRTRCFAASFGTVFEQGLDSDDFDDICLHVVLVQDAKVIATARLLDSQRAAQMGRFYSESEFYLADILKPYPYGVLEVGRTCIHPEYRGGKVLRQLWQAITQAARQLNVNAFMGCCSIPIGAGDINGWLAQLTEVTKLSVKPKYKLPPSVLSSYPQIPPLLQTYLKMGASLSEQACFDVEFHCADVWVWLPFEQVNPRYQHLL